MTPDRAIVPRSQHHLTTGFRPPLPRLLPVAAGLVAVIWGASRLIWRWRNRRGLKQTSDAQPKQRILIYRYRLHILIWHRAEM